ncbi:hypothetical protein PPL_08339 [Heterostelium album PN500]|uniref:Uncharacterized protein n=1 Tax=Heterostelium pallidum (strain ATCC 26659 / Pp 5 / PN500) TaxID=670386 RepID=D3BHX1_HETP5|nr:hypothetical protein PPL_08339 [Heterostelium album PN500]EFA78871.1 hypothetical protein PPL_08339 [Heterostelium album PN500]|eukprot:XP_020430995.1 hypothetical protein PPL_08339 [Heterostelium album PN500]
MTFTGADRLTRNEIIIKFANALNCMIVGLFPPTDYLLSIKSNFSDALVQTIICIKEHSLKNSRLFHEYTGYIMSPYKLGKSAKAILGTDDSKNVVGSGIKRPASTVEQSPNKTKKEKDDSNPRSRLNILNVISYQNPELVDIVHSWVMGPNLATMIKEVAKLLSYNNRGNKLEDGIEILVKHYHNQTLNSKSSTTSTKEHRDIVESIQRLHHVEMFDVDRNYSTESSDHCAISDGVSEESELFKRKCQYISDKNERCNEYIPVYLEIGKLCLQHFKANKKSRREFIKNNK